LSEELDCTYCQNLETVDEEIPSNEDPIFVKKYHICKASVFSTAFTKRELVDHYSDCTVRIEITGHGDVDELLNETETVNIIFQKVSQNNSLTLLKIDTHTGAGLASPCISQMDYFQKIAFLASVLEINSSEIRKIVEHYEDEWKGVKLLKQYLEEKNQINHAAFEFLERVIRLRNKRYPTHKFDSNEVTKIMKSMGLLYPVSAKTEWQRNWDATLRKFTGSLRDIRLALQKSIRNQ